MAIAQRIRSALDALLAVSTYQRPPVTTIDLDTPTVEKIREALGGALQPIPVTKTRWFQADLETAQHAADGGDMSWVGQLWRSMRRDGYVMGLSETRTAGLLALPKRWRGDPALVEKLRSDATGTRSYFDDLCPSAELGQHAADALACGIAVGEMLPVKGRDFPVFCRLDPEFLRLRWNEQRWYYQTVTGLLPITPGDGRWVLTTLGGRVAPWQAGLWHTLGRAFITKEHAMLHRGNFSGKLANPARLAFAPNAATEDQRIGFLSRLLQWGLNTTIELPPGWDAKLLESNGRGWEVFKEEIDTANQEIMIALAGQFVTVTGGTGFANADIHETIRADLIKRTGDAIAHTVNTQILPQWAVSQGLTDLSNAPRIEWDTKPPTDQAVEAKAMSEGAKALEELQRVLAKLGVRLDHEEVISKFGWPTKKGAPLEVASTPAEPGTEPDGDEEKPSEDPTKPAPMIEKRKKPEDDDAED